MIKFRLGEFIRGKYGSDIVAFDHEEDLGRFVEAMDAYFNGELNAADLREKLFQLGVSADQIRRVLAGERLLTVSGPAQPSTAC